MELEDHIVDSETMGRCFGLVTDLGGEFEMEAFDIGRHKNQESYCRLRVSAPDEERLRSILHELHQNGANRSDPVDATLEPAPADRVVPTGNCLPSTTNVVRVDIDPATVTQLLDRGSSQALGMVTDVGTFVPMLAEAVLD